MCHCTPGKRTPCCGPACCGNLHGCAFCTNKPQRRVESPPLTPETAPPFGARTALAMATNRKESQRGPEAAWWGPQTDRVAAYEEADRLLARLSLLGFEVRRKDGST